MIADIIIEIFSVIRLNKLRATATGFAVMSGIFLLIVLLGAGNGLIHTLEANSGQLALDAVYIYPGWTSQAYGGYKEGRQVELDETDAALAMRADEEKVLSYETMTDHQVKVTTDNSRAMSLQMIGAGPRFATSACYSIKQGRFINEVDMRQKRKVAVLCETLVERLFSKDEEVISRYLRIDGLMYQIVGVLKDNNSNTNEKVIVPESTLRLIYQKGDKAGQIVLKTRGLESLAVYEVFEKIYTRMLALKHMFSPEDSSAIYMYGGGANAETMHTAFSAIRSAFWFLGLLTLLSGITGVSNIMLISVRERVHEFGIRRAIGAKPWHIIMMVILESIIITTFFGYIGMVGGIAFCGYMDHSVGSSVMDIGFGGRSFTYFQDPTVGLDICIEATVVMIIAGAIAGLIPARKAARIRPIEALQSR